LYFDEPAGYNPITKTHGIFYYIAKIAETARAVRELRALIPATTVFHVAICIFCHVENRKMLRMQ